MSYIRYGSWDCPMCRATISFQYVGDPGAIALVLDHLADHMTEAPGPGSTTEGQAR